MPHGRQDGGNIMKIGRMKRNGMMALAALGAVIGATPAEAAVRYQFSSGESSFDLLLDTFVGAGSSNYTAPAGSTCAAQYIPCSRIGFVNNLAGFGDLVSIGDEFGGTGAFFQVDALVNTGTYAATNGSIGSLVVSQVNAAPEPAAWAMLILGFGLAGTALRRRRAPALRFAAV